MDTTTRQDTTRKNRSKTTTTLKTVVADARILQPYRFEWKDEEKRGDNTVPAHYHARIVLGGAEIDVHLRDNLQSVALGSVRLEIRERTVTDDRGAKRYLSLNLYPAPGEVPETRLMVGKFDQGEVIERDNGAITLQTL